MTMPVIQYGYVAGEVNPEFHGRTDLVKYGLGLGLCENFFVGYRGGIYSRLGFQFAGHVAEVDDANKLFRFRATGDDYVLVFGDLTMRVVRNGGYIIETAATANAVTKANPGVVTTSAAHGYSTGDWVVFGTVTGMTELSGRTFQVGTTSATTFQLLDTAGNNVDTSSYGTFSGTAEVSRVYTLTTPYAAADLEGLALEQEKGSIFILTHEDYKPRTLTYTSDTSWALAINSFGSDTGAPTNVTLTPSGAGSAGVAFAVTALVNGVEGLASDYAIHSTSVNYTTTAGSMLVEWDAVTDADEYYIYRSLVLPTGTEVSLAQEVGYIGRSLAPQFTDNNIIADFTKTPPVFLDPFADSAITYIEVTAAGTGYAKSDTVTVSGGGGSGFDGYPVVNNAGEIIGVVIVNGGSGYSSPTVTFNTSGGSGATATATVGASSGNNPALYRRFQQRGVYAGTVNFPMTLWGSKPGLINNMDVSVNINDGDAYSFELDDAVLNPIKHLVALRTGLLVFTEAGVTQIKAVEGVALTPLNALAEPQVYSGVGNAPPVPVGLDVIYAQDIGGSVNAMQYTEYTNSFTLLNLSALSSHLKGKGKLIKRFAHAEDPDKLIWAVREDGRLLSLTYEANEEVYAWAQHSTYGYVEDAVAVKEGGEWKLYVIVKRYIGGRWQKFIEVMGGRRPALLEDFTSSDCGLSYAHDTPAADLSVQLDGTIVADASVFVAGDVDRIIYAAGGKLEVDTYTSGTQVSGTWLRAPTENVPQDADDTAIPVDEGDWSIATPVSTVTGLWHLEGETVSVLADGDAFTGKTVANGSITLDNAATKIHVGLQYKVRARTLPVVSRQEILEGSRRDVLGVSVNLYRTRGLAVGPAFDQLVEMKDRTDEDWGEQLAERSDTVYEHLDHEWTEEGVICFEQAYPLPATILAHVADVDKGDT